MRRDAVSSVLEVSAPYGDPHARKTDYVSLFGAIALILASTIAIIVVVRR